MNICCQCPTYIYSEAKQVNWEEMLPNVYFFCCCCFVCLFVCYGDLNICMSTRDMVLFWLHCTGRETIFHGLTFGYNKNRKKKTKTKTKNNERLLSSKMSILAVDLGTVEINIVWIFVPMETNISPGTTLSLEVKCFYLRSTRLEFQDSYWNKEVYFLELTDLS